MGEEEPNGSFIDTWLDSPYIYEIYDKGFTLLKEMHNPTRMDPSHYDNFALTDHLGELVLSPTSYTSKFCNSHPKFDL